MLDDIRTQVTSSCTYILRWSRRRHGVATFATIALLLQHHILAGATEPSRDPRCESYELRDAINLPIRRLCWAERDACIEERITSFNESQEQAMEFCSKQPLSLDSRYVGSCPSYLEKLETAAFDGEDWLLPRIDLRRRFAQLNERGIPTYETYKREESALSLRLLLAEDPDNLVALVFLKSLNSREDIVEDLTFEIRLHELDPDCPNERWFREGIIFNTVNRLADNWLAGSGAGSELSKSERRQLLQEARNMLLDMYDIAVEQDSGTKRLYWALQSVHNAVLSGPFENLKQIAVQLDIDLEDYVEERTATLVQALSNEYSVESEHGRKQTFGMMCNDYAFELGLDDHCLHLLEEFGQKDAEFLETLSTDWAQAAILLVNWLTRDCSSHASWILGAPPSWWNVRRCAGEDSDSRIERISSLLARFSNDGSSAEHELLEAYLRLDDRSDEHFRRSLDMDSSIAPYGARLSKRLLKQGDVDTASEIVSSMDEGEKRNLSIREKRLLDETIESVRTASYKNLIEPHRDVF